MQAKTKNLVFLVVKIVVLAVFAVVFVFPVYMIFSKSIMAQGDATAFPPLLWPGEKGIHFENYTQVFSIFGNNESGMPYMISYFLNTLLVVLLSTIGVLFSSSFVAFGFCKIRFKGRNAMFMVVLATMMIPAAVTMVPLYVIFSALHLTNTTTPLWLPMWFGGGALNIFLVKQYMMTLPKEISEAGMIDGAGYFRQYFSLLLPNSKPILIAVGIGAVTGAWNDLQGPLTYISSNEHYTLTMAVSMLSTDTSLNIANVPATMAACMYLLIPPCLLFIFGQKYFIESVVMSGIKG